MIYNIYRSTDTNGEKKPCEGAYFHKAYIEELCGVVKVIQEWRIAINTLQDLQNLIAEVGELIINEEVIEIYDGYRE